MSPEQLLKLQKLSRLFEDGLAGPDQIKQLSEILANINQNTPVIESQDIDFSTGLKVQL